MRTSPIHYIAPSAISIIPNCNNSANDLAVTVARGAKILVYSPATNILTVDGSYQEWTFAGRNRRLADSTAPYTVYVRLPREDRDNGYVVFVAKDQLETEEDEDEVWVDHYSSVTNEGNGYSVLYQDAEGHDVQNISQDYYYIRLGDVSKPSNGARNIDLDTGILGTDAYNNQWSLNPDELPLRIELSCTVGNEDAGPTPYVYWGQVLTLTAKLVEGWEETTVARFHHWVIARSSGDVPADMAWPSEARVQSFANLGQIPLSHNRGAGDDFNGAVSALFTVTAMGVPDTPPEGEEPQETVYTPLAQATVNIQAETVEKYDLQTNTDIVSYNPQDGSYTPAAGVTINVRATDQRGNLFNVTRGQFHNASLAIEYAAVGSDQWTALTVPSTPADSQAQATLPISAFQQQQSVNLRLVRVTEELFRKTVAFVRDGEDSGDREWIFLRSTEAITFGDASSQHPLPSLITVGEVNPTGAASGTTPYSNTLDGWVPQGWWDEEQGVDATNCYEYASYRDHIKASGSTPAHWGAFTTPIARNHWGQDGNGIVSSTRTYARASSQTSANDQTPPTGIDTSVGDNGWATGSPAVTDQYPYLWAKDVVVYNDTTMNTTKYYCIGAKGDNGIDAQDVEWAYIRTTTNNPPVIYDDLHYADHNGNDYTADDHLPRVADRSDIEFNNSGDVAKRYECTDDPKGVDDTYKYEWEIKRTKGQADTNGRRTWQPYSGTLTLHSNLAEEGTSPWVADLDNEMDSVACDVDGHPEQIGGNNQSVTTNFKLYHGSTAEEFYISSVQPSSRTGATIVATPNTLAEAATSGSLTVTYDGDPANTRAVIDGKDEFVATLTAKNDNTIMRQLVLTINGMRPGANGEPAVLYQLKPSMSSIPFQRLTDNTLYPPNQSVGLTILKTVGGTPMEYSTAMAAGVNVIYSTDSMPSSSTPDSTHLAWRSDTATPITVPNTVGNLYIAMFNLMGTLLDRETIPVVKDGAKGSDGDEFRTVQAFKQGTTAPTGPTATTIDDSTTTFEDGWSLTVPTATTGVSAIDYSAIRTWLNNGVVTIPSPGDSGIVYGTIRFKTTRANATISIKITASTEFGYDFGAIGKLDSTALSTATANQVIEDEGTLCAAKVSGIVNPGDPNDPAVATITFTVATAGQHSVMIAYAKDGSTYQGDDNVTVEVMTLDDDQTQIYVSTATFKNGVIMPTGTAADWSTPVRWDGADGSDGWTVTVNPSPIILNQKLSPSSNPQDAITTDFGLPMNVVITAKHGNSDGSVNLSSVSGFTGLSARKSDSYPNVIVIDSYTPGTNVPTKGVITCNATLTDGTSTVTVPISISVAINMLGSFVTTIEGDVERSVATKIQYGYDNYDETGLDELETIGKYIRSSEESVSTLTTTVNGHTDDISEMRQTSDRISMSVGGWLGNLLAQTDFISGSMEQWTVQNGRINTVQKHDGYNSYYGIVPSGSSMLDVLQQYLIYNADGIRRISEDGWFTLSFWAMGSNGARLDTFFYPSCVVESGTVIIDGEEQEYNTADYDGDCEWTLSTTWTKHTFTFRTRKTFPTGVAQFVLFRLYGANKYCYISQPRLEIGAIANEYKEGFQWAGIDMTRKGIRATADNFEIQNSSGQRTFYIDADGNIVGAGNASFAGNLSAAGGTFAGTLSAGVTMARQIYSANQYMIIGESYPGGYTWRGVASRYSQSSTSWYDAATIGALYVPDPNYPDDRSKDTIYGRLYLGNNTIENNDRYIEMNGFTGSIFANAINLGPKSYSSNTTSSSPIAQHSSLIIIKNGCTNVYLPSSPREGEMHLIRNASGADIRIYGNGKDIDTWDGTVGTSSFVGIDNRISVFLFYDGTQWYMNRIS